MKTNMGFTDRTIRLLIAVALTIVYYTGEVKSGWWVVLPVIAIIMAVTSIVGFCPLYKVFGIHTKPKHKRPA